MGTRALALTGVALVIAGCSQDAALEPRVPTAGQPHADGAAGPPTAAGSSAPGFGNAPQSPAGGAGAGQAAAPTRSHPTTDGDCGAVTQRAQNVLQPVDIIFGVDTTGSMGEEIGFTEQNMNAFSEQISQAGIDVRVIMISGQKDGMPAIPVHLDGVCIDAPLGSGACPADSNLPGYLHVVQPLADWDILQNFVDLYPMYRGQLRENSFKTFVSISDSDIQANPILQLPINDAGKFTAAVEALEPPGSTMWQNWRYSSIYAFSACGIGNGVGTVHADLVERTRGVAGDLCLQDFAPVFDDLARQVQEVVTLSCDWEIPAAPDGETFDPTKTNVQLTLDGAIEALGMVPTAADCQTRDGWRYDDDAAPRHIVACPSTCARIQGATDAQVDLLFGCETFVLPPE